MILWGISMGAQESVLRAAVARLSAPERRGTAYGIFHAVFGTAWFAGSAALGLLYDRSPAALAGVAAFLQLASASVMLLSGRTGMGCGRAGTST
jgi:predicted MFS family arabinose efflux permease